jgi:hypothetical protein
MTTLKIQLLKSTPLDLSFHSLIPKIKQPSSFPSPSATINNNKEVAPTNPMVDSFTANRSSAVPSYQQGHPLQHVLTKDPTTETTTHYDLTVLFPSLIVKTKS